MAPSAGMTGKGMGIVGQADIDRMAAFIVAEINLMKDCGNLPANLRDFGDLHDHFDANVGWSDEIDALNTDVWAAVQAQVNTLL